MNRTSQGSVSVVRTTFKVYGKQQTLTFSQPKTPKPIVTKFEWRNYVVDIYHQNNHIGEIYTPPVFACLLFWFFNSTTGKSVGPKICQTTWFCARKCLLKVKII